MATLADPPVLRSPAFGRDLSPELAPGLLSLAVVDPQAPGSTDRAPFDGRALATIPHSTVPQVDMAFDRARAAQAQWAGTPARERMRILLRFHDLVLEQLDEGMDLLQWETGKTRMDAFKELIGICSVARYYARRSARLMAPDPRLGLLPGLTKVQVARHPVGVVGILSPWNYPAFLAVADAIPALTAGNAVVLKPDHQTTLSALWAVDLLYRAGLPRRALQVVLGPGPELGPEVIDRSDYVVFTGSSAVGATVAARCGQRLIGCSLELGGKNPMLVLEDADPAKAAEVAIRACFDNAGQLCVGIERIYTVGRVHKPFLEQFLGRIEALRPVAEPTWEGTFGSLINAAQLDRVATAVRDALDKGATLLTGGHPMPEVGPSYFAPTVLTGVTKGMRVHGEETFGPVSAVTQVGSQEEAVALANDSEYGLNASVVTGDPARGAAVARSLRVGSVNVNEAYEASFGSTRAPMGGMGRSGHGRRNGDPGLVRFTEEQTIAVQRVVGAGGPEGMAQKQWAAVMTAGVRMLRRSGLR